MSDWQERITRETAPSIRAEHELRYRIAAPLVMAGGPWVDLGCGNGLGAAAALGADRPRQAVLVDIEADVAERAAEELAIPQAHALALDLTEPHALRRLGELLDGLDGDPCVTCFEVIEHLSAFVPLVEWAREASERGATFVLSVPNDAFWSIENPHHLTAWGEGAFEELLQLLPAERLLLRQVQLTGSVVVDWDASPALHEIAVRAGGEQTVATHFIAAFGPRRAELWRGALAVQAEQLEERRWQRERESGIVLAERRIEEFEEQEHEHRRTVQAKQRLLDRQQEIIVEQRETLRRNTREFDEWRSYIHELEGELGRPLSGTSAGDAPA